MSDSKRGQAPDFTRYAADCAASKLTAAESAVAFRFIRRAMMTKRFYESLETMAQATGLQRKSVQRAIEGLQAKGLCELIRRGTREGDASIYRPVLNGAAKDRSNGIKPAAASISLRAGEKVASERTTGVASERSRGVVRAVPKVASERTPKCKVNLKETDEREDPKGGTSPPPEKPGVRPCRSVTLSGVRHHSAQTAKGNGT